MAFQIDEKLMATNRAIITRNKIYADLEKIDSIKFKPGMIHYVAENQKLWLSIDPKNVVENGVTKTKTLVEILTSDQISSSMSQYVNRSGGATSSMSGPLHSTVANGTAPFVITSGTKVTNLNADRVDDMHASTTATANTIVARDNNGNIAIKNTLSLDGASIKKDSNGIHINGANANTYIPLKVGKVTVENGSIEFSNPTNNPGLSVTGIAKPGKLEYNKTTGRWECGSGNTTSVIITKENILEEGINIILQTAEPQNVTNQNTYWYEIKSTI